MDILDQIAKEAVKAGEFMAEKAVFLKDYTVNTWNTADIRNKMNELYKAIGKAVYTSKTTGADTANEIEEYMEKLQVLEAALKQKAVEKEQLTGKKYCHICGKASDKKAAFCSHCGSNIE